MARDPFEQSDDDAVQAVDDLDDVEPLEPISDPVATARRRHGAAGAMLAAGLLGVDQALGRKPKEEAPVVVDASDDPVDIDTDGIVVPVDAHTDVVAPALPRTPPIEAPKKTKRR